MENMHLRCSERPGQSGEHAATFLQHVLPVDRQAEDLGGYFWPQRVAVDGGLHPVDGDSAESPLPTNTGGQWQERKRDPPCRVVRGPLTILQGLLRQESCKDGWPKAEAVEPLQAVCESMGMA